MNIQHLRIDGFGAWTGLKLEGFEPGLNVIYGPNEAGKSTLLEFVRSVLYGFSASRRERYLPPVNGGPAGGALGLQTTLGAIEVTRHDEQVKVIDAEGVELDAARLPELLGGMDERTFNHVFAVSLSEIQELATLDDSAAAQLLYNLTTGLDRVVLGDVMRELTQSRRRLLSADAEGSQIPRLLAQRNRLRQEMAGLADLTPRYARLVREREQLQREIADLERESSHWIVDARLLETALSLREKWARRATLDEQLSLTAGAPRIPPGALERLETIARRLRSAKSKQAKLREERKTLRELAGELPLQGTLVREAARIHALCDQQEWIVGLERRSEELKAEIAKLEAQISQQRQKLELDATTSQDSLRRLSKSSIASLKPLASAMDDARRRLEEIKQEHENGDAQAPEPEEPKPRPIKSELPRPELESAIEKAGDRVSLLRRRVQLDQRVEQMQAHQQELEEAAGDLLERQLLPLWVVVGLGALFVLGVVLILAGWWLSFGWTAAVLGVAGIVGAIVLKYYLESAAEEQLESNEKQLALLKRQIEQAKEERDQLDEELPQGGGPLLMRLEKAEKELDRLESQLPVEEQPRPAPPARDTPGSKRRIDAAETAWLESIERWRQALGEAGFPEDLEPEQVWQLAGRSRQLRDLYRQVDRLKEEQEQTRRAVRAFGERVAQLLADVALMPASDKPSEQLRQLRKELASQESLRQKRRELASQDRKLRRRFRKVQLASRRLLAQRRRLFELAGAIDEADFRRRVAELAQVSELRSAREAVQREIVAALGTQYTEDSLRRRLESLPPDKLEDQWIAQSDRLKRTETALKQRFERCGAINHELEQLAADRRLPERQLELSLVEARLKQATRQWQARAATSTILESVRSHYERERQPQTLKDASELLREMTSGRYTRVWTPMEENRLLVDDAEGRSLSVEVLSRGTREQLFLSLRLALVRHFSRRGVKLPVVLDDVLVNFDAARASAAASLLAQFAAEGRQVVVFTCHDHIAQLFESLAARMIDLPNRFELRWDLPEHRPIKRPRSRRKTVRTPQPVTVPQPVIQPPVDVSPPGYLEEPPPPPVVEILEAEPVVEPPILVAEPLPEPPRAKPLVEESPPLPANAAEAEFVDYDLLLPRNREPHVTFRPIEPPPPKRVVPLPPPVIVPAPRPRARWGFFQGEGAEEFTGEFATRPMYEE